MPLSELVDKTLTKSYWFVGAITKTRTVHKRRNWSI